MNAGVAASHAIFRRLVRHVSLALGCLRKLLALRHPAGNGDKCLRRCAVSTESLAAAPAECRSQVSVPHLDVYSHGISLLGEKLPVLLR